MNKNLHNLFVISSPSGGGKTSLLKAFFEDKRAKKITLSISHTTRKKRLGDIEGKDYFFIDKEDFSRKEIMVILLKQQMYLEIYMEQKKNLFMISCKPQM